MARPTRLAGPLLASLALLTTTGVAWALGPQDPLELRLVEEAPADGFRAEEADLDAYRAARDAWRALPAEERTSELCTEYFRTLYHLGAELARCPGDAGGREFFRAQAQQVLEELVFAAGEESDLALHAYHLLGDLHAEAEEWEQAARFYKAVIRERLTVTDGPPERLAPVPRPDLRRLVDARREVERPRDVRGRALLEGDRTAWEELELCPPSERAQRLTAAADAWRALPALERIDAGVMRERYRAILLRLGRELAARAETAAHPGALREDAGRVLEELAFGTDRLDGTALRALELLGDLAAAEGDWRRAAELYGTVSNELTRPIRPPN